MKKIVQREIENIRRYIERSVFTDARCLLRNIRVMQYNVNFEWFNCAIIALNSKDIEEIIVNTKQGWESVYGVNELEESGVPYPVHLLKPYYDVEEDEISFVLFPVYYQIAFNIPMHRTIRYISNFEKILEQEKYEHLRIHLKNKTWFSKALQEYLQSFLFYIQSSEKERNFYFHIMQIAFGELLKVDYSLQDFTLPEWDEDQEFREPIVLYKNIHVLITQFHLYIKTFLKKLGSYDTRMRELELIKQPEDELGYEILNALESGEDVERFFGGER